MANDTATVTQTVNSVTVEPPTPSSLTVTETSGGSLTLSDTTVNTHSVTVSPTVATLTIESDFAVKDSPNFTGTPTAPTASAGTNTTQLATTAFVNAAVTQENTLLEMGDVAITSLTNDEILQYNSTTSKWINQTLAEADIASATLLSSHTSSTSNPHSVTASQVGLGNVTNESKATMFTNPVFTGNPTVTTQTAGNNSTRIASTAYVTTAINNLIDSSPATLNTLNELAAALNDDANFAGTVTSSLALKAPLASPALTGTPTAPTASAGTNTTQIATTAFVTSAVALENTLAEMDDVTFASLADNELLQYNSSNSKWENKTISEVGLALASDLSTHIGATNPHNITLSGLGGLPLAGGTLTGVLKLPDGAVGAPALSFANDADSGIYWDNANKAIRFSIDGVQRGYFSTAGILSQANVYTGNTGQFRNYGGTWKATTGLTGNGFEFSNSVDGTAMTLSSAGVLNVTGNITLGGTVDGRDVAADGAKLDNIEPNATADQTAAEILTAIKTVDGTGSGLDADTLDGSHASTFAAASDLSTHVGATNPHNITASTVGLGNVTNESKATMFTSAALTGTPTAPTASAGTNTTQIATTAFVTSAVALENTLAEMDDVAISNIGDGELIQYNAGGWSNVTLTEAGILPLAGGTMTGDLTVPNIFVSNNAALKANGTGYLELGNTNSGVIQVGGDGGDSTIAPRFNNLKIQTSRDADDIIFLAGASTTEILRIDASTSSIVASGNLKFNDSKQLQLGNDADLQFYSDNTQTLLLNNNNDLIIKQEQLDGDIKFLSDNGSGGSTEYFRLDGGIVKNVFSKTVNITGDLEVGTTILHTAGNFNYISSQDASKDLIIRNTGSGKDMVLQVTSSGGTAELLRLRGIVAKEIVASGNFEIRNGTNSRHINLYETYTDSSNYERSFFKHASSFLEIGTEAAGTGTASGLKLKTGGNEVITIGTDQKVKVGGGTNTPSLGGGTVFRVDMTQGAGNYASIAILGGNTGRSSLFFGDLHAEQRGALDYRHGDDSLSISTAAGERMRILSDGKVGIGTTTPSQKLDISAGWIELDTAYGIQWGGTANRIWGSGGNNYIKIETNGVERLRVDGQGDVGIGVTNPSEKLSVGGNVRIEGDNRELYFTGNKAQIRASSSSTPITFVKGSTEMGGFNSSADFFVDTDTLYVDASTDRVGIGTTSPSTIFQVNTGDASGNKFGLTGDGSTTGAALWTNWTTGASHLDFRLGGTSSTYTKMRIQQDGKVGIGTVSPNFLLDVEGSGASMRVRNTATDATTQIVMRSGGSSGQNQIVFGDDDDANRGMIRYRHNGDSLAFDVADAERMRIDSSGRLGIGTTTIPHLLTVKGTISRLNSSGIQVINLGTASDHGQLIINQSGGTTRVALNSSGDSYFNGGSLGVGMTAPTARLELKGGTSDTSANTFIAKNSSSTSLFSIRNDGRVDIPVGPVNIGNNLYLDNNEIWAQNSNNLNVKADGVIRIQPQSYGTAATFDSSGNTTLAGDLTVQGDISTTGSFTIVDTDVSTTEQLSITNDGTGPALIVNQTGVQPIVDFKDDGTSVFNILNGGDIVMTGDLRLPDGTGGSPSLTFSNGLDTGFYRSDYTSSPQKDQVNLSIDGNTKFKANEAGIWSVSGNIYFANGYQVRTFQEWLATTGGSGYGFKFRNTADSVDCLVVSATGNLTPAGVILAQNGTPSAPSISFTSDTNTGFYLFDTDRLGVTAGGTCKFVVGSTGVGVGSVTPTSAFHLTTSAISQQGTPVTAITKTIATTSIGAKLSFTNVHNANGNLIGGISMGNTGEEFAGMYAIDGGSSAATHLAFFTGNSTATTEAIRILSDGKVGIGTTTPSSLLNLSDASNSLSHQIGFSYVSGGTETDAFTIGRNNSTGNLEFHSDINNHGFEFKHNAAGTQEFNILNMNVGIGTDAPAVKLDTHFADNSEPFRVSYAPAPSSYYLTLDTAIPTGSVVSYRWHLKNNGTEYSNNLVLDRGKVGIGAAVPDSALELEVVSGANTQTRCFHIDHNPTGNTGSGYMTIRSGTNTGASASLEQVSSGGGSLYGTYSDTNLINHGTQTSGAYNNINFVTNNAIRMTIGGGSQAGNVGIGTTAPAEKLHVSGNARIGNNTTNGHLIGRKDYSVTQTFSTGLTVELGNHKACHVKVFISGDWANHSSFAYVGEFFIQNTGDVGTYNEPGIILTEHDNLPTDGILSKIVDGTSDSFEIQFRANTSSATSVSGRLCYHVMGDATSVS